MSLSKTRRPLALSTLLACCLVSALTGTLGATAQQTPTAPWPAIEEEDLDQPPSASQAPPLGPATTAGDEADLDALADDAARREQRGDVAGAVVLRERILDVLEQRASETPAAPPIDADGTTTAASGATQGPATQGPATQGPATQGPAIESPATQDPATGEPLTPSDPPMEPRIAPPLGAPPLSAGERALAARAAFDLARAQSEFGQTVEADLALERLLRLDPSARVPSGTSAAIANRYLELAGTRFGDLTLLIDPADARVAIDGRRVPALDAATASALTNAFEPRQVTVRVLAGERRIEVQRAGYASIDRPLAVTAGEAIRLEMTLDRTGPVLRLRTRPTEARVVLDGRPLGRTTGWEQTGREALSEEVLVSDIPPGPHVLEITKEGFRPYRADLDLYEAIDYQMPPIALEEQSGLLAFGDFPAGATIAIDGRPVEPEVPGVAKPRVRLPPGEYLVTVSDGQTRTFATRLQLADRQTIDVQVELRPGLAFLGVLDDTDGVEAGVRRVLGSSPGWTLIDAVPEGAERFAAAGLDAATLRALSESPAAMAAHDWARFQRELGRAAPALLYAFALAPDPAQPDRVDLWLLPAAPGPARPGRLALDLGDPSVTERLARQLQPEIPLRRPRFGALVIDSIAGPYPVLADVPPASPADAAGLQLGDQIVGYAGVPVQSAAALDERVLASESGEPIQLAVKPPSGPGRNAVLTLSSSPWSVLAPGAAPRAVEASATSGLLATPSAVLWARLATLETEASPADRWVVFLDQAHLLLQAGAVDEAVRRLRQAAAGAPQNSHGFGRGAVDYWLGVALSRLGERSRDGARLALEAAARLDGARDVHDDGPYVAPRARARLLALD